MSSKSDKANSLELLENLKNEALSLQYNDDNLDKVKKRAEMLVKNVFGQDSEYLGKLEKILFSPIFGWHDADSSHNLDSFNSGKKQLLNLIDVMLEEITIFHMDTPKASSQAKTINNKVFIVHGHNEEMKQSAARFVEQIRLKPIILHEQPSKGKTIIEKFEEYSNVSFAVVLLSADDVAYSKDSSVEDAKLRARQNVIFELGYFIGFLGRERVVALYQQADNFEIPSDYQGVLFIPYDRHDNWKYQIVKELKALGYDIDANRLV